MFKSLLACTLASFYISLATAAPIPLSSNTLLTNSSNNNTTTPTNSTNPTTDTSTKPNTNSTNTDGNNATTDSLISFENPPKVRGVNLGGWLVTEPWITPSLFQPEIDPSVQKWDEWTLTKALGKERGKGYMESHWKNFITQDDFKQIKQAGLNLVRIPIGYWAFDVRSDEPYVTGQVEYLNKAIEWSRENNLQVMIDLHGVPGSQNGYDNSGRAGPVQWAKDPENVERTKRIFQKIVDIYGKPEYNDVVTMIQAINEPAAYDPNNNISVDDNNGVLRQYYTASYGMIDNARSQKGDSPLLLTLHDGFFLNSWNDFLQPPQYQGVVLDHHEYTVFTDETRYANIDGRVNAICSKKDALTSANEGLWTIVGEWSPAITDCAGGYTKVSGGSSYEQNGDCTGKTGPISAISEDTKSQLKRMFDTQRYVYETTTQGFIMWTWKTESVADWSYSDGIKGGWIPKNLDETPLVTNSCG